MGDEWKSYKTLVRVCAYCKNILKENGDTLPKRPLKPGEAFTHGVCNKCNEEVSKFYNLKEAMRCLLRKNA